MRSICLLILISVFSGCVAPNSIIRLSPEARNSDWLWGREFVRIEENNIQTALALEGTDRTHMLFDVEITNHSADTILVAPERFFSTINQQPVGNTGISSKPSSFTVAALDPEIELLTLDKALSGEEASYRSTLILQTTEDIARAAVVAQNDLPAPEQLQQQQIENWNRSDFRTAVANEDHHDRINYLRHAKFSWERDVLRKTSLLPGETIRGLVIFPTTKSQRSASKKTTVAISLPISDAVFQYNFRQQTHHP